MSDAPQSPQKKISLAAVSFVAGITALVAGLVGLVCFGIYYGVIRWTLANGPSGILFFIGDSASVC